MIRKKHGTLLMHIQEPTKHFNFKPQCLCGTFLELSLSKAQIDSDAIHPVVATCSPTTTWPKDLIVKEVHQPDPGRNISALHQPE